MFLDKALTNSFLCLSLLMSTAVLMAGEALYSQQCAVCHADQAQGKQAMNAPALSQLDEIYISRQLKNFKNGLRGAAEGDVHGQAMAAISKAIPEESISSLASYIAQLPVNSLTPTLSGDAIKGQQYYDSLCGTCHGPGGKGNEALKAPRLSGMQDWYFVRQYQNFSENKRGYHKEDRYGRQMKMMAKILPDEQALKDVAAYLQTVGPEKD